MGQISKRSSKQKEGMTSPFSEAELVERPAGPAGVPGLGRASAAEVVLRPRLRAALARLNPGLTAEGLTQAEEALCRDRGGMGLLAANRELYALLKDGVPVEVPDGRGGRQARRARAVDWRDATANDVVAVRQLTVAGPIYTCRPDLVGFVNGLPWVLIECKAPSVPARRAFDDNLTSYKHPQNGIPRLCAYNAVLVATNGTAGRVGSLSADSDRFGEWKRIAGEDEPRRGPRPWQTVSRAHPHQPVAHHRGGHRAPLPGSRLRRQGDSGVALQGDRPAHA